jgi:hypothetical protein
MYEGIIKLAAEDSRGDLEAYVAQRTGRDFQRKEQDLAGLRLFLALNPQVALERTLVLVHWCIKVGHYRHGGLYAPCEGGLFSLGFFESLAEDRVILSSFKRYLDKEPGKVNNEGLAAVFSPRFNGIVWLHERQQPAEWMALIEALDRKFRLYEPEDLEAVKAELRSPPTHVDRDEFLFPPFSIHRRLRALVR